MASKVCAVFGYGPGVGAAVARKWAKEGYAVAIMARSLDKLKVRTCTSRCYRLSKKLVCYIVFLLLLCTHAHSLTLQYFQNAESEIANCKGYACDVTKEEDIRAAVASIEKDLGPIDCMVYNAGNGVFKTWDQIPLDDFEMGFRTNTKGLLAAVQLIAPKMTERGSGSILITGATASLRGKPFSAGFAPHKGSQRLLAQSLARDLGPKGVHVGLFIIDGGIGEAGSDDESKLNPDHIADTYWHVATQPKSCWSFETEIRPSVENW